MTTATPAKPANTETALQPWEPKATEVLKAYPETQFNLLVPTVAIRQVNPYLVPDIEVVKLSIDESKGDIYHDSQMKQNYYAPTAKGLAKIRQVAGIDEIDSRRTDDGRDPDVIEWTVVIEMVLPSGQRVRAHGSKRMDMKAMTFASPNHERKQRQFLLEHAQTKALNRAIRSILSLHGAMPKDQLAKPFAILRWVPNMSDPDVRRRMLDNLLPATAMAYGPEQPRQVGPGAETIEAEQAPDDEAIEGELVDKPANGHTNTVDTGTGEIVAQTSDEPDWFGAEGGASADPDLVNRLRKALGQRPSKDTATPEQRAELRTLFEGLDISVIVGGLRATFEFAGDQPRDITAGHAKAILAVAAELGRDVMREQWQAVAE